MKDEAKDREELETHRHRHFCEGRPGVQGENPHGWLHDDQECQADPPYEMRCPEHREPQATTRCPTCKDDPGIYACSTCGRDIRKKRGW